MGCCGLTATEAPGSPLIESADEVYVSAASIWEVAIKARLGKIQADPYELSAAIEASGFLELPLNLPRAKARGF
jgi:PIN domain nuclease of toxin-antitoxin system